MNIQMHFILSLNWKNLTVFFLKIFFANVGIGRGTLSI